LGITEHQLNNSISFHKKEKSSLEFKTRREYLMKLVQENLLKEDCTHKRIKRDVLKNVVVKKADLNEKIAVVEAKGPTKEEREEEERILEEARQEMLRTKERYEKLMAKRRKIESSPEKPQTNPSTSTSSQKSVHRE
jgi:lipopolysaccharide export LptBFGC system permease protein LptF